MIQVPDYRALLGRAERLYDQAEVEAAISAMAAAMTPVLAATNPVVLCVMTGGVVLAGKLLTQLEFALELDYLQIGRYGHSTQGGEVRWRVQPAIDLKGRTLLLLDDILDEGATLVAATEYCKSAGADQVFTAVLVDKRHDRKVRPDMRADFTGLHTEDRYLFGYGLDYQGYLRNAPGIFAL